MSFSLEVKKELSKINNFFILLYELKVKYDFFIALYFEL